MTETIQRKCLPNPYTEYCVGDNFCVFCERLMPITCELIK